jgi:hypothetical protein
LRDALQCVTLEPLRPAGYVGLASALLKLERWDDAEAACEHGIELADECLDEDELSFADARWLKLILTRMIEEAGRARAAT